jgi:hypothetical protein
MALGYVARSAAQAPESTAQLSPYRFVITAAENGRVRLQLPTPSGSPRIVEYPEIRAFLFEDRLIFQPWGMSEGTVTPPLPAMRPGDIHALPGFAYRFPKK